MSYGSSIRLTGVLYSMGRVRVLYCVRIKVSYRTIHPSNAVAIKAILYFSTPPPLGRTTHFFCTKTGQKKKKPKTENSLVSPGLQNLLDVCMITSRTDPTNRSREVVCSVQLVVPFTQSVSVCRQHVSGVCVGTVSAMIPSPAETNRNGRISFFVGMKGTV